MNIEKFIWHTPTKQLVTICCASFQWAESNIGTICYKCKNILPANKREASFEAMNFSSQEEYNKCYQP